MQRLKTNESRLVGNNVFDIIQELDVPNRSIFSKEIKQIPFQATQFLEDNRKEIRKYKG
jgi:hypothetical protein